MSTSSSRQSQHQLQNAIQLNQINLVDDDPFKPAFNCLIRFFPGRVQVTHALTGLSDWSGTLSPKKKIHGNCYYNSGQTFSWNQFEVVNSTNYRVAMRRKYFTRDPDATIVIVTVEAPKIVDCSTCSWSLPSCPLDRPSLDRSSDSSREYWFPVVLLFDKMVVEQTSEDLSATDTLQVQNKK